MGLLAGHTVFTGVEATTIRASFQGNPMKSYLSGYGTGGLFKFFGDLGKWNTLIDSGTDSATVLQCEVRAFGHTQRKGRSKKNWTSCSDENENSRIKFRFWSSYFQCVMKPTPAFVRVNATLRFVRLNAMVGLHLLLQTNFACFS